MARKVFVVNMEREVKFRVDLKLELENRFLEEVAISFDFLEPRYQFRNIFLELFDITLDELVHQQYADC